jgi:hypothetical protein
MRFRNTVGALTVALALSACGKISEPGCHKDSDCASGSACSLGACVPRIKGTTQTWALELVPKADLTLSTTEKAMVTFGADPAELRLETKARIDGQIAGVSMPEANSITGDSMRVVVSIPSTIGRGERQFETEASRPANDQGPLRFTIFVPQSAVGHAAKITLFPAAPLDQVLPVWSLAPDILGPTVLIDVPSRANELSLIEGVLQDELGLPPPPTVPYLARAMMGDRLVSNVYKVDAQGRFKLKVPTAPVNAINLDLVKVELVPADPMAVEPRLQADVTASKLNLGVLGLPPRAKPQMLDIRVESMGTPTKNVAGVTLRFRATLNRAFGGQASVERQFQTDRDGIAHVTLLPGPAGQTLAYEVTAVPPPNSEFAARCFGGYAVASVAAGQSRFGAGIALVNKLEVTGRVTDGAEVPQPGVIMTAIRQDVAGPLDCGVDVLPSPTTVTTGPDGSYRLFLDPGRYRFEYEPPMGSATALHVESNVLVDKSLQHPVKLPGGVLATGVVSSADGEGVLGCEVRVFGRPTEGKSPVLRARTRTTADGRFSIVLPKDP